MEVHAWMVIFLTLAHVQKTMWDKIVDVSLITGSDVTMFSVIANCTSLCYNSCEPRP